MKLNERRKLLARVIAILDDSLGTHIPYTCKQKGIKHSQGETPSFHIEAIRDYAEAIYLCTIAMGGRRK